jgi:hypothetical protein
MLGSFPGHHDQLKPRKTTEMDNSTAKIIGYHVISLDFADGVVENAGYAGTGPKQL